MKKILSIILVVLTLGLSTGCDKFLNPQQIDLIYNDVFWTTETDAQVGLNGVYALYRGLMADCSNWYQRADATTGFWKRGWTGGSSAHLYTEGVYGDIQNESKMWGSADMESMAHWGDFYKVVSQANMVIAKVEEMPENAFSKGAKDRILGEAYFLRGLVYFNILRIWGNAPYISEMIESSSQVIDENLVPKTIARTDDIVIGQNILADVQKAVEKLDYDKYGSATWGIFADKGAALALQGHVNMWMNFLAKRERLSAERKQYLKDALTALETYENEAGRSYVNYSVDGAVEAMYKGCSTEAVFELCVDPDNNESYRADSYGIQAITCKFQPRDGLEDHDRSLSVNFIPFAQKAKIYPEYDFETQTGDIRPHLFFDAWDSTYDEAINDTGGANNRSLVTWMTKFAQMTDDSYADWDEYNAFFAICNIPVFRHTDVMLLLAEAYCKDKKYGEARAIVNTVRARAGLDSYSGGDDALLDEVLQQRTAELIGEGHLYFDYVRNETFPNAHLMSQVKFKEEGYYWPVAGDILRTNPDISQTPYWNGKTKW